MQAKFVRRKGSFTHLNSKTRQSAPPNFPAVCHYDAARSSPAWLLVSSLAVPPEHRVHPEHPVKMREECAAAGRFPF
jgi:hypothetical protein